LQCAHECDDVVVYIGGSSVIYLENFNTHLISLKKIISDNFISTW